MQIKAEVLISDFRSDTFDDIKPYFFSDELVLRYLDEGQKRFCRDGVPIIDSSTPEVAEIDLLVDQAVYSYHPSIRRIRTARLKSNGREVKLMTQDNFLGQWDDHSDTYDYGNTRNQGTLLEQQGEIRHLFVDYEEEKLRLSRKAQNKDTILLHVERGPINTLASCSTLLEIKEEYHRAILEWALFRGYSRQDSETFDMDRADRARGNFETELQLAKVSNRKRHGRLGKVSYGGI